MSAAAGMSMFDERIDPGKIASFALAAAVHLLLLAILVFGVSWQNRPPESIAVELWEPPPPAPVVEAPKPLPQVEPTPPVAVKPEPVKPEPVVPKPEIVEKKAPPPKPKPVQKVEPKPVEPRPVLKAAPKPVPKAEPSKPRVDDTRRMREEMAREQRAFDVDRERQQLKDQVARDASSSQKRDHEAYAGRIKLKIRGNIVLPQDVKGNPEAIFDVVQLPTGEVLSVKLRKSSGHAGYDEAVERAVLKSSPLPRPDKPDLFQRALELKFRPLD